MSLVAKVRRVYFPVLPAGCIEDLEGEGMIGLVQASLSYHPDRGCAFTTWAWYRMRGAMVDARRRESFSSRRSPWVDPPTPISHEALDVLIGSAPNPDHDQALDLHAAIRLLPDREAWVINMLYFHGYTLLECSTAMSLTESRVCQIAKKARALLAESLTGQVA